MNKELINKNQILNILSIESNTFDNLIEKETISQYLYEGNTVFDINEINNSLKISQNLNSRKFQLLIKIGNKTLGILGKIIPLFYTLGKIIEMYFKGLIGG